MVVFPENYMVDGIYAALIDNGKLCRSRNLHRQWERKLFYKKTVKIYYSTILNNNGKDDILCGRMSTMENSQSNQFITVLNVKSKVK